MSLSFHQCPWTTRWRTFRNSIGDGAVKLDDGCSFMPSPSAVIGQSVVALSPCACHHLLPEPKCILQSAFMLRKLCRAAAHDIPLPLHGHPLTTMSNVQLDCCLRAAVC